MQLWLLVSWLRPSSSWIVGSQPSAADGRLQWAPPDAPVLGAGAELVGAGADLVGGDAGLLAHGQDVDLVVRHAAALGGGQFGGAYVHAAVELGGVGVDHLGAPGPARSPGLVGGEGLDEVEGEFGLAAGRRPDDGHAHRRGPRGAGIGARADTGASTEARDGSGAGVRADTGASAGPGVKAGAAANGAGAHGGAPHSSGRSGPTRLRACVHEDRAVSRWSLSWVSVTPELRSVR